MIKTSDFQYDLPDILVAQHPPKRRDDSRLMLLRGSESNPEHHVFRDLPALLKPGDCLVVNNTRVIPARLTGCKHDSKIPVEFMLLNRRNETDWEVMVRPGRRVRVGHRIDFMQDDLWADILDILPGGNRLARFHFSGLWENVLEKAGAIPLPPYIHEKLEDPERYQTIYACCDGSAAAPTAGLHFSQELMDSLCAMGISIAELTLHVGLGTFRPVKTEYVEDHQMHAEYYELPEKTVGQIQRSISADGRIVAVGTTTCRVLESVMARHGYLKAGSGWTDIFIYPGFQFKVIDALLTNFHLPESTLLMLVSAFAGRKRIMDAYKTAIHEGYRFFSFGDAMLIFKRDFKHEQS